MGRRVEVGVLMEGEKVAMETYRCATVAFVFAMAMMCVRLLFLSRVWLLGGEL